MSSEEIEIYLSGLRSPDKMVRAGSMEKLVESGTVAVPHLLMLLTDDNWVVRYRAAEALGGIRDSGTVEHLINLTLDQKDHVRYMATKSLSKIKDPRIQPVLIRMLSDNHPYTRKIAAGGLVIAGGKDSFEPLQKALNSESDSDVRVSFEAALTLIKK